MKMITDLDKTIVYSRETSHICIERKDDGTPVTYMTRKAVELIEKLMKMQSFLFIPCTLRSFEQTKRISFTHDGILPIIICDNGFSIYRHGRIDEEWDGIIRKKIDTASVLELHSQIADFAYHNKISLNYLKNNRQSFISVIFHTVKDADMYSDAIISLADKKLFRTEQQGRKVYIIPNALDKAEAVKYIINSMPSDETITAGDSMVDFKFTELGNHIILPRHSEFLHKRASVTQRSGIYAGEDILSNVWEIARSKHLAS